MIPRECKRLAEVDFPIAAVSRHAVREKSIRHGHPSTLHLWWARRPLASSRAVLMALLLPDPCDPHCPMDFKNQARGIVLRMQGRPRGWSEKAKSDIGLRRVILEFISDFASWNNAASNAYLNTSRALVKAAHGDEAPVVVDPFAGGGSIPLEALRVGCESIASDINPVACMILKTMLEDIPRHSSTLAEEIQVSGRQIKERAERELSELYPTDPDGSQPIAYLWARTVQCEAPNCGAEIPLMGSFWLRKKPKSKRALRHRIVRKEQKSPRVELEVFEPKADRDVYPGTIARAKATCLCCGAVLPPNRVRAQIGATDGGADVIFDKHGKRTGGSRMTAVVTVKPGVRGRNYRVPTDADYTSVHRSQARLKKVLRKWQRENAEAPCPIPDEPLPLMSGTFNVPLYGMNRWGDLFTARQKVALQCLSNEVASLWNDTASERKSQTPSKAAISYLALLVDRVVTRCTANCIWDSTTECIMQIFNQGQALPFRNEYAEMVPLSAEGSGWETCIRYGSKVIESARHANVGQVLPSDAVDHPMPDQSASVWFTDPPYYFAVPYADLSDFFFVWLKRTIPKHPLLAEFLQSRESLTPKGPELCEMAHWDSQRYGHKDKEFFENGMAAAFVEGRRILREGGIGSVVFAHKTTEGWEALLSGIIRGGWTITASWPIATESRNRLRAQNSAALATSVHLVCRPRPDDAPTGDWANVLRELPGRVGDWMERLQNEGVRGADLVFACVGPALEIFSRYSRVETAEGDEIGLPVYLERVWEVVGRTALENVLGTDEARARNGQASVLEEDARLTALFLWAMQSTESARGNGATNDKDEGTAGKTAAKGLSLPFDVVRRFAQPMGINLEMWSDRIIEQKKGVVRLLPVTSRAAALFGHEGTQGAADWIESDPAANLQQTLFPETEALPKAARRRRGKKSIIDENAELQSLEATALDRVHAAMLLQSSGHSNALRKLIVAEQERGPEFLRLANALSALYPLGGEEKRLLDGMLLAVPR